MNYFLIIFVPSLLYFIEELFPSKNNIYKKIGICFLIIMSGLRYGFGADYFTYEEVFNDAAKGIFPPFEFIFSTLIFLIAKLGLHFNFLLFIIAAFNYTALYKVIEQNLNKYKWLAIFLFLIYFDLYFYSLSAIRQSIAMSIFLYASVYIRTQNKWRFILCMIIASQIHMTALLLIPIYFIYNKIKEMNTFKISIIFSALIIIYPIIMSIIKYFSPYLGYKFYYYFVLDSGSVENSNLIIAIVCYCMLLGWIFITQYIKNRKENKQVDFPVFSIIILLALKTMQFLMYFTILPRIQMYFYCFYILAIPNLINKLEIKQSLERLLIIFVIISMTFLFVLKYSSINQIYSQYYSQYNLIIHQ
ncbi:EpsG family protein [Turicibacter sanguinis]|uniref:EpsG family protein n=1 Tax=Turicibacter sanguinis TaxID=154288 RepID=UPI0018A9EA74|nr:EpsG family protein [Turicibacter sanguinis]